MYQTVVQHTTILGDVEVEVHDVIGMRLNGTKGWRSNWSDQDKESL